MVDAVQRLKKAQANAAKKIEAKEATLDNPKVIQLPIWPERTRGLPNTFARSALFTVGYRRTPRKVYKDQYIDTLGQLTIQYTGEELRQDDESIFLQILHLASQQQSIQEPVRFTSYGFLKAIKWATSGQKNYDRLRDAIKRLKATNLSVVSGDVTYGNEDGNSLIANYKKRIIKNGARNDSWWEIKIDEEILKLFGATTYTRIAWEQRLVLKSPLEQWLHSFYFTHKKPFPMRVETIHKLCGSSNKTLRSFRQKLCNALDNLVNVQFIEKYWIDEGDKVHLIRSDIGMKE